MSSMDRSNTINQTKESDGLRSIAQDSSERATSRTDHRAAATTIVLMLQPGLDAHRAAWAGDQAASEVIMSSRPETA
jgi:hypothetical protein